MSRMGEDLIEAMKEILADSEGKIHLRRTRLNVSLVCETISVEEIKGTREKLGMSQGIFAMVMGVSRKTVESWETGRYMPDGAARRLITMLQADPELPVRHGIISR